MSQVLLAGSRCAALRSIRQWICVTATNVLAWRSEGWEDKYTIFL